MLIALIGATDALMLGRLTQDAVAAVSPAIQIAFIMSLFSGTVLGACCVRFAQYRGKGDKITVKIFTKKEEKMKKLKIIAGGLIALTAVLAVVSFIFLPETVITQFSVGGSGVTTMPKILAVALPTALGIGGALVSLFNKSDNKNANKYLLVSGVGIAIFVIMLAVNL